ncbi:ribonuclease P protein subunit p30-like [Penaeus japonicus]|uniref:ribonuclease P protein subunit p30-like n=1 Tax=Penaeus japonicus TaxID=27405 RepID=UPI001C71469C|nr:ribonuclease P protein subunit p30-like [Penaeus japonicus]XP_042884554.1 ribonuclease P protein subunit p30-like [Penaeus japonicus]
MELAKGFCDLNIAAATSDLKSTVLKALSIGYQTVAINTEVVDNSATEKKKKKKGNEAPLVPPPPKLKLTPEELKQHKITKEPLILTRITVTYSDPGSAFLSKYKDALKQYDIIAFTPITEAALKQCVTQTLVDVDIISLSPSEIKGRPAWKLIRLAVERDIYFEICYAPCLANQSSRQNTIILSHILHQSTRSANVVITSQARHPNQLRHPYDVMNLGRFFSLSEGAAKESIGMLAHNAVYCALARQRGASKCAAQVTVLKEESPAKKFKGLDDARALAKSSIEIND